MLSKAAAHVHVHVCSFFLYSSMYGWTVAHTWKTRNQHTHHECNIITPHSKALGVLASGQTRLSLSDECVSSFYVGTHDAVSVPRTGETRNSKDIVTVLWPYNMDRSLMVLAVHTDRVPMVMENLEKSWNLKILFYRPGKVMKSHPWMF